MDDHNLNPPSSNDAVLNVPGPYPCIQQQGKGKQGNIVLAYKILGVVFGALVTNPLFVYPSMHLSSPTEEDYLGLYSIMFWSLTLIGLVKYANIAIKVDDNGEGGTFALYSLLCRHLNIGFFSPKQVGLNSPRVTESQTWLAKLLKNSFVARRLLIFLRMMGTCMLVGDGVLTPAISVLAAMDGVRAPFPSFNKMNLGVRNDLKIVLEINLIYYIDGWATNEVLYILSYWSWNSCIAIFTWRRFSEFGSMDDHNLNPPSSNDAVLNVPGPYPCIQQQGKGKQGNIVLAYKSLGVVFGALVTNPLFVYPSMHLSSPTEEDYLGLYSIMFWSLTLIGLVKYANIAIKADDHGEGGTFALYSLLCRHLNIGFFSPKQVGLNSPRVTESQTWLAKVTESQIWLAKLLKNSFVARRLLLFLAMMGMCMLVGDGVLTPAISVLAAMDGVRAPFPSFNKTWVKAVSAVVLIFLFLLQRYGTSRVSFLFSPVMGAWTLCTPLVGIYSIINNYRSIFKAISPHYIVLFFLRNGKSGWLLLGGTVLCITGSEAMFADLGHFNPRSIQIAFIFMIYPSLVLTYAGQTAYLIKNPNDHSDGFYKFIQTPVYWPIFIIATSAAIVASQSLISATFSVIKQSVVLDCFPRVKIVQTSPDNEGEVYSPEVNYVLMILCVAVIVIFGAGKDIGNAFGVVVSLVMLFTTILLTLVMTIIWRTRIVLVSLYFCVFFIIEGMYVSAVLPNFAEGGWIPLGISLILTFIMFAWFYGRHKKIMYELTHKITFDRLEDFLVESNVQRVPGLSLFYSNIQDGLNPVLGHYIKNTRSLHKIVVFTTLRYILVPKVAPHERIVIKKLNLKGAYCCVFQYGFADVLNTEGSDFADQVITYLKVHIQNCPDNQIEEVSCLEEARLAGTVLAIVQF
ncbi:probable potassium transporter 17 [Vicia villosa]|uniref:probable potassium transporter 17 n=1 Tax=Vicia villosa TaxID=3911 RepID=UPI00273BC1F2|nr:probable potassium transporter 17 [Vicia villosa]